MEIICPRCGSYDCHYSGDFTSYECEDCGNVWGGYCADAECDDCGNAWDDYWPCTTCGD